MVKRDRYLTGHGPGAGERTFRGKLLQKRWCSEGATMSPLERRIKLIFSPVN